MPSAQEVLKLVTEKEAENADLYLRMDNDRDLLWLKKFVMQDKDDKDIPGIVNLTLNDPVVFEAHVKAAMSSTSQQTVVLADAEDFDTEEVEAFQKAAWDAANARLRRQRKLPPLNSFFHEQLINRGRAGARCTFRWVDGVLVPDIVPWDMRWVSYELGVDGLQWVAYRTNRTKDMIKLQYNIDIAGQEASIIDFWDTKENVVIIDVRPDGRFKTGTAGREVLNQPHDYKNVPFVFQVVPLGTMLADIENRSHYGESIFFMIRDIIPELNTLASMAMTANFLALKGAKQYASKEGPTAEPPDYVESTNPMAITSVDIGGGIAPVPIQDLLRAFTELHAILEARNQRGSLTSIDLGNLQFPLSGTALIEIGEGRDQVLLPRLQALALLNQELTEMFTEQILAIARGTGLPIELGTKGHKRTFTVASIEGEYETTYKFFSKSPTTDAGLYSLAAGAGDLLPERYKLEMILKVEDPDAIEAQKRWEEAERLSPRVKILRTIKALVDRDTEESALEAEVMSAELGIDLEAMLRGEVETPSPVPVDQPTQVLPLTNGPRSPVPAAPALPEGRG